MENKEKDEELMKDIIEDEKDINFDEHDPGRRSFLSRTFGPMGPGSIRGSIFAMASLAMGTGCLTLPIRFTQIGLLGGIVFLIIAGIAGYWSLTLMIYAAKEAHCEDYSRLVKKVLGKCSGIVLDFIMVLYIFGVLISYQVIIYSLIGRVYYEFAGKDKQFKTFEDFEKATWNLFKYKAPIMYGVCIILIPICLLKDISKMRFTSMFSTISLIVVIMVILGQSPMYYKHFKEHIYKKEDESTHPNFFDFRKAFDSNMYFFPSLATMFFAFTCHVGAFPVYKALVKNDTRRIFKVFRRTILLTLILYLITSISGFFTAPVNSPALIIYRPKIGKTDIIMQIGKIAICANLILACPSNYNSFRLSLFELVFHRNDIPDKLNYLTTIPIVIVTTTIGILYSKITSYISLLGGFCSVVLIFLMPGLLFIKGTPGKYSSPKKIFTICMVAILCSCGYIAGIETIVGMVRGE